MEGNKVPLAAALAFVRVPLQEGGTLVVQGDPLSLGPQLVGSLPQQRDTEGQDATLLLHGLLARRGPLHTCKAKGLCISPSWGQGSGPSHPGHRSRALVRILGSEPALLHAELCSTGQKGPACLAHASTALGQQCSAALQAGAWGVATSRSKPQPALSPRSWPGSPQPPELPFLRHRGIKAALKPVEGPRALWRASLIWMLQAAGRGCQGFQTPSHACAMSSAWRQGSRGTWDGCWELPSSTKPVCFETDL